MNMLLLPPPPLPLLFLEQVYGRLVVQHLYKLLSKDVVRPAHHLPWHQRPFMQVLAAAVKWACACTCSIVLSLD